MNPDNHSKVVCPVPHPTELQGSESALQSVRPSLRRWIMLAVVHSTAAQCQGEYPQCGRIVSELGRLPRRVVGRQVPLTALDPALGHPAGSVAGQLHT